MWSRIQAQSTQCAKRRLFCEYNVHLFKFISAYLLTYHTSYREWWHDAHTAWYWREKRLYDDVRPRLQRETSLHLKRLDMNRYLATIVFCLSATMKGFPVLEDNENITTSDILRTMNDEFMHGNDTQPIFDHYDDYSTEVDDYDNATANELNNDRINDFKFFKFINKSSMMKSFQGIAERKQQQHAPPVPGIAYLTGIFLVLIGIVMQLFIISYEISMDPMKRSLTNQVSFFFIFVLKCRHGNQE